MLASSHTAAHAASHASSHTAAHAAAHTSSHAASHAAFHSASETASKVKFSIISEYSIFTDAICPIDDISYTIFNLTKVISIVRFNLISNTSYIHVWNIVRHNIDFRSRDSRYILGDHIDFRSRDGRHVLRDDIDLWSRDCRHVLRDDIDLRSRDSGHILGDHIDFWPRDCRYILGDHIDFWSRDGRYILRDDIDLWSRDCRYSGYIGRYDIIPAYGHRVVRKRIGNHVYIGIDASFHRNWVGRHIRSRDATHSSDLWHLCRCSKSLWESCWRLCSFSRRHDLVIASFLYCLSSLFAVDKAEANLVFLLVLSLAPFQGLVLPLLRPVLNLTGLLTDGLSLIFRKLLDRKAACAHPLKHILSDTFRLVLPVLSDILNF